MDADCEGFGACRFAQRHLIAYRFALILLDHHQVAEAAVGVGLADRTAEKLHFQTVLRFAGEAELALAAGPARAQGDPVAGEYAGYPSANGLDGAGDFVTHDDRFAHADCADPTFPEIVDVRSADAAGANADQYLLRADVADFTHLDAHIFLGMEHTRSGLHLYLLLQSDLILAHTPSSTGMPSRRLAVRMASEFSPG